jgi:release factor glutamine methyltransferase
MPPELRTVYRDCEAALGAGLTTLPDQPAETVATTLAALWHAAAGNPLSVRRAAQAPLPMLEREAVTRLRDLVRRRIEGTPLAHLTGRQQFMGLELQAGAGALIPREETELLGKAALARLREFADAQGSAIVIDVCTGSGNLAVALAAHEPRTRVWGADLDEHAVALARRNADGLGLGDRVSFRVGDLLDPFVEPAFVGRVDLVVCNPPYISSAKIDTMPSEIRAHEPRLAFDGGPFGVRILQRLLSEAPRVLRPGGFLAFEVGLGQAGGIRKRIGQQGRYVDVEEIPDRAGNTRALVARLAEVARHSGAP